MKTKILIGAFALCLGSAAMAQYQTPTQAPPAPPQAQQPMPGAPMPGAPMPDSNMADPNANVPPGTVTMPPNAQPADPSVPQDPAAPPGTPANPVTVGGNVTPPPPPQEDYPVCKGAVQDRCVNPGEGPKKAKSRRR